MSTQPLPRIHPKMPVRLGIETIGPERAYDLLARNTNNRNLRQREVSKYARDMRDGNWRPGAGEPVHIAPDGEIGNGQHRLMAVIEADCMVELPVLYAPIDYRQVADQGIKRLFGDVLKIEYDQKSYATVAAAVRLLWELRETGAIGKTPDAPTTSELQDLYLSLDRLDASTSFALRMSRGTGVRPGVSTALHYLFAQLDREAADVFFDRVASGIGLQAGDPILALRKTLLAPARSRKARVQAALVIKAWNAWRGGKRRGYFKMAPGEEFPQIKGLKDNWSPSGKGGG